MMLSSNIVWDETLGQGTYNFYKQAKEVERQINKDEYVIGMVIRVNSDLQLRMSKILEEGGNDNTGRAIDYMMRTIGRYIHKSYCVEDNHYMATIDLVLKKFVLESI